MYLQNDCDYRKYLELLVVVDSKVPVILVLSVGMVAQLVPEL